MYITESLLESLELEELGAADVSKVRAHEGLSLNFMEAEEGNYED